MHKACVCKESKMLWVKSAWEGESRVGGWRQRIGAGHDCWHSGFLGKANLGPLIASLLHLAGRDAHQKISV